MFSPIMHTKPLELIQNSYDIVWMWIQVQFRGNSSLSSPPRNTLMQLRKRSTNSSRRSYQGGFLSRMVGQHSNCQDEIWEMESVCGFPGFQQGLSQRPIHCSKDWPTYGCNLWPPQNKLPRCFPRLSSNPIGIVRSGENCFPYSNRELSLLGNAL